MEVLEPECSELMELYVREMTAHVRIADDCGIPRFSLSLRRELLNIIPDEMSVALIESVTRLGDFGNTGEIALLRKAVSNELKARGIPGRRGKRTSAGLLEFVQRITPLLLRVGVPLATSERSRLVRALRAISEELGLRGDPRDELRRLSRLRAQERKVARNIILRALVEGLKPLGRS